jgi:hypothetical protein
MKLNETGRELGTSDSGYDPMAVLVNTAINLRIHASVV